MLLLQGSCFGRTLGPLLRFAPRKLLVSCRSGSVQPSTLEFGVLNGSQVSAGRIGAYGCCGPVATLKPVHVEDLGPSDVDGGWVPRAEVVPHSLRGEGVGVGLFGCRLDVEKRRGAARASTWPLASSAVLGYRLRTIVQGTLPAVLA